MLVYARKNGKSLLSTVEEFKDVLEPMREKYEPLLKAIGAYDEMCDWQRLCFYMWLYKHEGETENGRWKQENDADDR